MCCEMFPLGNRIELEVNTKLQIKTSPLTPLLTKERGNKAQLYWGEVIRMNATRYKLEKIHF